jgi:hypothetical protein
MSLHYWQFRPLPARFPHERLHEAHPMSGVIPCSNPGHRATTPAPAA